MTGWPGRTGGDIVPWNEDIVIYFVAALRAPAEVADVVDRQQRPAASQPLTRCLTSLGTLTPLIASGGVFALSSLTIAKSAADR